MENSTVQTARLSSIEPSPRVGTRLTGEGVVVSHRETRCGLRVLRVEAAEKYPNVAAWMNMVNGRALLHDYEERINKFFFGVLVLYWKE